MGQEFDAINIFKGTGSTVGLRFEAYIVDIFSVFESLNQLMGVRFIFVAHSIAQFTVQRFANDI
ncbi:hypothetical protein D3C72_2338910 [compost metagenome]